MFKQLTILPNLTKFLKPPFGRVQLANYVVVNIVLIIAMLNTLRYIYL